MCILYFISTSIFLSKELNFDIKQGIDSIVFHWVLEFDLSDPYTTKIIADRSLNRVWSLFITLQSNNWYDDVVN